MKNAPLLYIINVSGKILNLLKKRGTPTGWRVQEAGKGGGLGGIFRGAISSPKVIIVIIKKRIKDLKTTNVPSAPKLNNCSVICFE